MRVTVVIPTYNRAYILRDALQSVLAQSFGDFEIVVVDDASTDDTPGLVRSVQDSRIRYIWHERNRGCSAAYNSGIAAARGDLIGFLDSDDIWKPTYLEEQVGFLARHSEVDAVFTDNAIVAGAERTPSLIALMPHFLKLLGTNREGAEYVLDRRQIYICLLEEVPIKPSALVVRKEIFERAGTFDEAWPSGTDWELLLRFSRCGQFGYINKVLVVQRRTKDATHQLFVEKDKLFLVKVFSIEKSKLRGDREALAAVNRGLSSHCSNLGWNYLHSGQRKRSVGAYLRGFKETHDVMMLARAASVCLPMGFRNLLKTATMRH